MKKIIITLLAINFVASISAQDATFSYYSYTGDDSRFKKNIDNTKEYLNPILAGFYPDPSVTRKGDTYYLVNSSFSFFPGVPIFESKDLVNWNQIGHVLDRESQLQLPGLGVSEGIYAPAISYNEANDTFYMITTLIGNGGNFFVKSKDPHQGWSDPIWLPEVDGIDPSFLFDIDGKAYIVHNAPVTGEPRYDGERAIRLLNFDVENDKVIGKPIEIVRGGTHVQENPIWIEGPHLYHIGDWYYLMCAEGGTGPGHSEVIFRAKHPEGPWEEYEDNPILTQRTGLFESRSDIVTSAGHADIIQTPEGDWWAVFLAVRPYEGDLYNTGRDTFLLPVEWKDGWPVILESGVAIPTIVGKRNLNLNPTENYLTGNFTYTDNFSSDSLNQRWISLRNPVADTFILSDNGITLKPGEGTVNSTEPLSAIFARQQHVKFTAETEMSYVPESSNDLAGMAILQNEKNNFVFGKTIANGETVVILKRTESGETKSWVKPVPSNTPLKLKVQGKGGKYSFYYSIGHSNKWETLAKNVDATQLSTAKSGGFIGAVIGLYNTKCNEF